MKTLGLCLIVKNESKNIIKCLESVVENIDVIYLTDTGSTDNTIELAQKVAKKYNKPIEISHFKWVDDYSLARQYNFDQAKTDWVFWIDADDTVENSNLLRKALIAAEQRRCTGILLNYRYHVDESDNDLSAHSKLRIVKNNLYKWTKKAPIHENLFIKEEFKEIQDELSEGSIIIKHHRKDWKESYERNIRILEKLEKREGDNPDPRTQFLLAREYHGGQEYEKSIVHGERYLKMSGTGHERVEICGILADIVNQKGHYDKGLDYAMEAVKSLPTSPKPYTFVAQQLFYKGRYKECIHWLEQALKQDFNPMDGAIHTPKGLYKYISYYMALSYSELHEYSKAKETLQNFLTHSTPEEQLEIKEELAELDIKEKRDKLISSFLKISNYLRMSDKVVKMKYLFEMIIDDIHDDPKMINLKKKCGLKRKWNKGTITLYCGMSAEEWDQDSLAKGLGGSETAVIEMTKRWAEWGYEVHIYNTVTKTKKFGNVTYHNFLDINWADEFDIFISWRNAFIFKVFDIDANKKFLWKHDVPIHSHFTDRAIANIDKVILLSKYHRSLLPQVPDEKIYISRNGIDTDLINTIKKENIKRNPYKVIYASSIDRGFDRLLNMWENVKKKVPQAELVWAYGWETYDKIRTSDEDKEWKKMMIDRMDSLGVKQLGRLSKADLIRAYLSSSIWAYPTSFPEISCIVAMEAQECDLVPITTGFAALQETQKIGYKISDLKEFETKLLETLQNRGYVIETLHSELYATPKPDFSWKNVAREWCEDLFYGETFEKSNPLVTIICNTIRPGPFRILRETLEKQTYQNYELIVVDGRYDERKKKVRDYMKDFNRPFLHIPDPRRDKTKYPYGLCHSLNAGVFPVNGELIVWIQDFIEIPKDGIEKYVELYRNYPDSIYTGVDTRNGWVLKSRHLGEYSKPYHTQFRAIDIFEGKDYEIKEVQFTSPRIHYGGAKRFSYEPMEWELNYAAAPTAVVLEMGGFNIDWDKAFGYDNTEFALRFIYEGGTVIVDETNKCIALSHWDMFPEDNEGVPHRTKKTNDKRYHNYLTYLSQTDKANVRLKYTTPDYPKVILDKILKFKKRK